MLQAIFVYVYTQIKEPIRQHICPNNIKIKGQVQSCQNNRLWKDRTGGANLEYLTKQELEKVLYKEKLNLSIESAKELTHNMYEITYTLPESKHSKTKLKKMDDRQAELYQIVMNNF
jgi:hypothetical protein